jgi:hypothetical protein
MKTRQKPPTHERYLMNKRITLVVLSTVVLLCSLARADSSTPPTREGFTSGSDPRNEKSPHANKSESHAASREPIHEWLNQNIN